jgi:hypothetical protein
MMSRGLSERPRFNDRWSGKGLKTPANIVEMPIGEFFNGIGHLLSFEVGSRMSALAETGR